MLGGLLLVSPGFKSKDKIKKGDKFLFEKYQQYFLGHEYDYDLSKVSVRGLNEQTPIKGVYVHFDLDGDKEEDVIAYFLTKKQSLDQKVTTKPHAKRVFMKHGSKGDYVLVDEDDDETLETKYSRKKWIEKKIKEDTKFSNF